MNERDKDKAGDVVSGEKIREEGEKNRREMDEVPEPGTDPLHEGP